MNVGRCMPGRGTVCPSNDAQVPDGRLSQADLAAYQRPALPADNPLFSAIAIGLGLAFWGGAAWVVYRIVKRVTR